MKNYVLGTVIAAILIAVIAVVGVSQLRGGDEVEEAVPTEAAPQEVPQRPDCPAGTVAGVELDCLGGKATGKRADEGVSVVNVWVRAVPRGASLSAKGGGDAPRLAGRRCARG